MTEPVSFSECFWRFIKENVGISRVYPAVGPSRQQKNRKVTSFEERQERISKMLQKTDYDDDKLDQGDAALAEWQVLRGINFDNFRSGEAVELAHIIKQLGVIQDVCVEDYILSFFKTLSVQRKMLNQLDPALARFNNLKVLNLSFNLIEKIEFLPPSLEELYLNGNQISEIHLTRAFPQLVHLGLSMNKIRQPAFTQIVKLFPSLFCLDISFNDLCDLEGAITWCAKLESLKMLFLEGNPLVLIQNYQRIIHERMPTLKVLDGNPVFLDQETIEAHQKTMLKRLKTNAMTSSFLSKGSMEEAPSFKVPIQPQCSIDLHIRLLRNVEQGRYLILDDNCSFEQEKLDEIPVENKSSHYWVSFTDHTGTVISTKKRAYIEHFQVEETDGKQIGRTDMEFRLRIEERPSIELRDWINHDIALTLWEQRPLFEQVTEEGKEPTDRVVVDPATELPKTETRSLGVAKVKLMDWLKKSPLNPTYSASQKKKKGSEAAAEGAEDDLEAKERPDYHRFIHFFPGEMLQEPEFMTNEPVDLSTRKKTTQVSPNLYHMVVKGSTQSVAVKMKLNKEEEEVEDEAAKKVDEEANAAAAGAKAGKADPKKDAKGKGGGKNGAIGEDKNSPQILTVEYEENVDSDPSSLVYEMEFSNKAAPKKGHASSSIEDRLSKREKELVTKYEIELKDPKA